MASTVRLEARLTPGLRSGGAGGGARRAARGEIDARGDAGARGVAPGEGERLRREIDGDDLGLRQADGQRHGDGAAADADVGDAKGAPRTSGSAERAHP